MATVVCTVTYKIIGDELMHNEGGEYLCYCEQIVEDIIMS